MAKIHKAQAALEFLTTHLGAFIVLLLMIGAFSYFGILSPKKFIPEMCNFGSEIDCIDQVITNDWLQLRLKNNVGENIVVKDLIASTKETQLNCVSPMVDTVWYAGDVEDVTIVCDFTDAGIIEGEKNKLDLKIIYHSAKSSSAFSKSLEGEISVALKEGGAESAGDEGTQDEEEGGEGESPEEESLEIPSGTQRYFFRSNPSSPQLLEAIIDPLDVHVGDTQTMTVKAHDNTYPITFVTAEVETDTGERTYQLSLIEGTSSSGTWQASWTVVDTHSRTYHTTFTVENSNGETSSTTLTWDDPCAPSPGGSWTLDDNCGISGNHGVSNGDVIIADYTITINDGAIFVWNPGKSISITTGSIAIAKGGQLRKSYLWMKDADADGYPSETTMYVGDTAPEGNADLYKVRDSLSTYTSTDTNDADSCADTSTTHTCGTASGGSCVAKAAGEQGLGTCQRCNGASIDSVNIADNLQDTEGSNTCSGTCTTCNGAGSCVNQGVEDLFSQCGGIDCSGYYVPSGTESATATETCYDRADEAAGTHNCEGDGTCRDAADDCPSNSADTVKYSCGTCKYIAGSDCTGTTLGSCTNHGSGTSCGTCKECNGAGSCGNVADGTNCGGESVCYSGTCYGRPGSFSACSLTGSYSEATMCGKSQAQMDQYCKDNLDARYWVYDGSDSEIAQALVKSSGCYFEDPEWCTHPDHPMRAAWYYNYGQAVVRHKCAHAAHSDGGHGYCPDTCSPGCTNNIPILCCR